MSIADIRQAIFEKLHELETDFAVKFSQGATIYVIPTDGAGSHVVPHTREGPCTYEDAESGALSQCG